MSSVHIYMAMDYVLHITADQLINNDETSRPSENKLQITTFSYCQQYNIQNVVLKVAIIHFAVKT